LFGFGVNGSGQLGNENNNSINVPEELMEFFGVAEGMTTVNWALETQKSEKNS
jgi:hypothetical protein